MTPKLNRDYSTLIPAYGRDYKSRDAIIKDFDSNKDFMLLPEKVYINKDQIEPGTTVELRYKQHTQVTVVTV